MRKVILIPGLIIASALAVFSFKPKDKVAALETLQENAAGIQFIEEDWKKALQQAKEQSKLIFLDAYTSWCGPCKLLKRNTFPDKNAGDFFNKNFINVAVDMEKGYGPALAQQYGVNAYPSLIIADAEGGIVVYTRGYINPKQLIEFGKYGLSRNKDK